MKKEKKDFKTKTYQYESFIKKISLKNIEETFDYFQTSPGGLSSEEAQKRIKIYGFNTLDVSRQNSLISKCLGILFNRFNIILFLVIIFSYIKDIYLEEIGNKDYSTLFLVILVWFISNFMHFIQEARFSKISEKLRKIIETNVFLKRDNQVRKFSLNEVVLGDIVYLSSGDVVAADIKLFETKDFLVKETSLTGENNPVEKDAFYYEECQDLLYNKKILFMGTTVVSGYAKGVVISTGNNTYLGHINKIVIQKKSISSAQKDINNIVKLLTFCIFVIAPFIFIINLIKFINNDSIKILDIFIYVLTIILGITPEMLPLIVSTSFLIGIFLLSKKKVIVKNLYSIQDFSSINFLFTDKTGTLTEDRLSLDKYLDLDYKSNDKILKYSFLNSYFQTGIKSPIDATIIENTTKKFNNLIENFYKIDEIPFDFKRRIVSVIIRNQKQKYQKIISKGAIEEILNICRYEEITDEKTNEKKIVLINKNKIFKKAAFYNQQGFRLIFIAYKNIFYNFDESSFFSIDEENNMILLGFLTFFDIPKKSAIEAISDLKQYNVKVKILTGDNAILTQMIASQINLDNCKDYLLGQDIDILDDDSLYQKVSEIDIIAKLNPEQKARIVNVFKKKGNIIGFMGDGINDAPAMQAANLAISVDSGVDIAKESADVILLNKDLRVLKNGIVESRKVYTNMLKYLKFTLAANFGNVLSILLASFCFSFIPLLPSQILFLNLIYDISCLSLPFDNVDYVYLKKPRQQNFKNIVRFMILFGTITFLFDFLFFCGLFLFDIIKNNKNFPLTLLSPKDQSRFQASWFVFSIWTQILTIFNLRTEKIFHNSQISKIMLLFLISGGIIANILAILTFLGFQNPFNTRYIIWLIFSLFLYFLCLSITKKIYIKKYKELL
ncbi:magnesium-translocating P-type ATPase [Candidatus Phytoplasma pini]|uniref:Magnesium-transporting ATPase, P-type 1 n=1 Tax=Candidatus Phytoplasma pini TaxID=267362 RepID=A0A559KJ48_9MOLU|nr:magnesium-translocating P-type ATPase [Candidatus Phytoplasma pini]TVY12163.1 Magnesium-translocating P-type ATPase [Candidatus Phytoplasma pini]